MRSKLFTMAMILLLAVNANAANLVGLWEFDNAANLGEATIGTDLTWTGSPTAAAGVAAGDGAAFSPIGTYLTASNPIGANGGGTRTNEYTILIDFKLPTINAWNPVFETTNPGGISTDGDYWISTSRGLGVASEGYVDDNDPPNSVQADTWHRLVIYIDQGTRRSTYVDAVYIGDHNVGTVDGRWTLDTTFSAFGDNTASERADFYVSNIALFDGLLTDSEIVALGVAGDSVYPKIAYGPTPEDGDTFVPLDTNLSWSAPTYETGTATYAIYFGATEPNELLANYGLSQLDNSADTTATTIDPEPSGDLLNNTTYYWVVNSYDPNNGGTPMYHPGIVWSFTTVPADPIPARQPEHVAVFPTETAVFTATADSDTPLYYQWKKVTSTGDVDVPGAASSTLTLTEVTILDEGYYYCQFINDTQTPINSDPALLTVKRQLVHLPLDGDTLAGEGTAINGVGSGDLEWVAGISGSAVSLTQDNTNPDVYDYIKLADDANDLLLGAHTDFTVSVWVQTTGLNSLSADAGIISNKDWDSGGNVGWIIASDSSSGQENWQWNMNTVGGTRKDYDPSDQSIVDGAWHQILVSHDRDGNAEFYFDGIQVATRDISANTGSVDSGYPTVIGTDGAEGTVWARYFIGAIDEVEIWNYTMDRDAVATLYERYTDISPCVYPPALDMTGPAGEPDCRVNLYDFAEFAAAWLNSEIVQP